jgi:hypothetical protein
VTISPRRTSLCDGRVHSTHSTAEPSVSACRADMPASISRQQRLAKL